MKVLLFAYHFPPAAASQGVRWKHLTEESAKLNFEWDVLTASLSDNRIDAGQTNYLLDPWSPASGVRVHPTPVGLRHAARRLRNTARGNMIPLGKFLNRIAHITDAFWIPDRSRAWMGGAVKKAVALHREQPFDMVVSSGIPVSAHVAARRAARLMGVPWVADWGDPWGLNPVLEPLRLRFIRVFDRWLERVLVREANAVTVTTDALANTYQALRPGRSQSDVMTLRMGYDDGEFQKAKALEAPARKKLNSGQPDLLANGRIRLIHTGLYYEGRRDPTGLMEALSTRPDLAKKIEVISVGPGNNENYIKLAKSLGISDSFRWFGSYPRVQAIAMQCAADVLLSFGFDSPYQIPGKLSEYAACDRPVMHIRGSERDPSLEVTRYLRRSVTCENTPTSITDVLEIIVQGAWVAPTTPESATLLSWPALAAQLVHFLQETKKRYRQKQ